MNDGFFYNYWNAAWALVQGLNKSGGRTGRGAARALPHTLRPGFQVANGGVLKLDSRRQAIQDQYPLQITKALVRDRHDHDRGLRPERRPDVRWRVRPEQAGAGPELSRPA